MKRVYTAAHLPDAQLLVHTLESSGVRARVFNENLQGGLGELPHVYPEVWIDNEEDWERARALVGEFEANVTRDVTRNKGVVRCQSCHEENPRSFEICWQCGAALPILTGLDGSKEEKAG